jgi:large subunit ribosomal protein L9
MEVILLEKIRNLGGIGDKVSVKPGFARNYLLPQGKAITATSDNLAKFEKRRAELEQKAQDVLAKAQERATALRKLVVKIPMQASEEGKLFGSVGVREIVEAVHQLAGVLDKNEVILPEGAIRQTGVFDVQIMLHSDVVFPVKVEIVAG